MDEFIAQLQTVLKDQRRELHDLREKRKHTRKVIAEIDAKEAEVILGIQKTVETLEQFGVDPQ